MKIFVYVALMALVAISQAMTVTKMETLSNEENDVTCSEKFTCPDKNTCCKLEEGGYGCCPLPEAVCCPNVTYCCPNGYKCDVSATRCIKGDHILAWFTKGPAKPAPVNDVTCPDKSTCPDGNTCCELAGGGYGCCPLPEAVCCSDKIHCCPSGYKCDVSASMCFKGDHILAWFTKGPAKPAPVVNGVTCPDQSTCPDNTTCCEAAQGGYGCCPLPKATCCSDKIHCCPEGYKCDVAAGLCLKGDDILTWFTKYPTKRPAKSTPLV